MPRLRIYLYHIPQVSGAPLSVDLVARLAAAFPGIIAGVKDSAGDWENTQALLARVPQLAILVGHEPHLPRLLRAGGAGTICGVGQRLSRDWCARCCRPTVTAADEQRIATFIDIAFRQPFLAGVQGDARRRRRGDPGMARRAPAAGCRSPTAPRQTLLAALARRRPADRAATTSRRRTPMNDAAISQRRPRRARRRSTRRRSATRSSASTPETRAAATRRSRSCAASRSMKPIVGYARTAAIRSRAAAGLCAGRAARAAGRLLPLHRCRPEAVDRRDPGPRRDTRATARSGAKCSRPSTSGWARAASSPTARCATSTNGRRASSSSPAGSRHRTPTPSR